MDIKRVLVIGAGQMGSGIALVLAKSGVEVVVQDIKQEFVDRGMAYIQKTLDKDIEKGRMTAEDSAATYQRVCGVTELNEKSCAVDLVIEAAIEQMDIKAGIFKKLDELCPEKTILASNTSSLPITSIGATTNRPEKVVGVHFFNPVPVMKLVEIISGQLTSQETTDAVFTLVEKLGKSPVRISDFPGFAGNRIMVPMINEAIFALMEGVASAEDIDKVAQLGFNHPMGPLALSDLIGNDTVLHIMEVLYEGYGDPKYRPCPLLRRMVQAKLYGRKSGRGFYDYSAK
ncbi:MAG: 3-hydroxybutyryl-CoA dehydrogenase [Negativicutes bacterium]|nr:3-hydroxybutyryl-CoA dehydrogenase [Negativicutes bacterium]